MTVRPCDLAVRCPCTDLPVRSISAEGPDPADHFGFAYVHEEPNLGDPSLRWGTTTKLGTCYDASQQVADDCARRDGKEQIFDTWQEPNGPALQFFGNHAQTCELQCPNGSFFTLTIPASTVFGRTQAEADAIAASECLFRMVRAEKICVASKSIELVGLDNMYDLADTEGVIAGDLTGLPAVHRSGATSLLPVLGGTTFGSAFATNGDGSKLTGDCQVGINDHGVWWDASAVHDLPTLAGSYSIGDSISDDGFIFTLGNGIYNPNTNGYSAYGGVASPRGCLLRSSREMNNVHSVCFSTSLGARDIYRWNGALTIVTPAGTTNSLSNRAIGINESSAIVGRRLETASGRIRSFYNPSGGSASSVDLGAFAVATDVQAESMNAAGLIVGSCGDGLGNTVPFKWSGALAVLPMLPATVSGAAHDVNSSGDIVGEMGTKAFLYRNGVTFDLYTLIPDDKKGIGQWTSLEQALFINDAKFIAGFGTHNGTTKAYLLRVP